MLLDDCELNVDAVSLAPLVRTSPEEDWAKLKEEGVLPEVLFLFYQKTMFMSFSHAPNYLKDDTHALFSYLGMLLRGLKESFAETEYALNEFVSAQSRVYDPGKRVRGETWDADAPVRARRAFRQFLYATYNGLDLLADLVALMVPGVIPRLHVGAAQFQRVEDWLKEPLPPLSLHLPPVQECVAKLHRDLGALVVCKGPERDWLPYLRQVRNKAAHYGDATFRELGLHDKNREFYVFIPRVWPFIWEQHIKPRDTPRGPLEKDMPTLLRDTLIHQDIISFAHGAKAKVRSVSECGIALMSECYTKFSSFPQNRAALEELDKNSWSFGFKHFV